MSIQLTTKQKSLYLKLRILLFIFAFLGLAFFGKELLFPTFIFNYFENSSSLQNTITKPYLTQKGSGFDISTFGNFDTAKIVINLSNNSPDLPENTKIKLRKSYSAFLSPISNEKAELQKNELVVYKIEGKFYLLKNEKLAPFVSEKAFNSYSNYNKKVSDADLTLFEKYLKSNETIGFADGSVLAIRDEGVFVISEGQKRPVGDEFILKSFGFSEENKNLEYVSIEELSAHKKDKMFLMPNQHPDGTIFYATDSQKYFLFENNTLFSVEKSDRVVNVEQESRDVFAECTLKKNWLKEYVCEFDLKDIEKFTGNFYEFSVVDIPDLKVKSIEIKFSQKLTKENLTNRLRKIKDLFKNRY